MFSTMKPEFVQTPPAAAPPSSFLGLPLSAMPLSSDEMKDEIQHVQARRVATLFTAKPEERRSKQSRELRAWRFH
jgi:hypothetical protein